MTREEIEQQVIDYLEQFCDQDGNVIRKECDEYGDIEVDSLHFIMIIGYMAADLGITITPADIDTHVKRSFKDFCDYVESLLARNS